ncbi:dTDP-4-dehydrorhamnose reductase [soil metagenome]
MKRRIVIVGAGGRLGAALQRAYASEHHVVGFNHAQLDLAAPEQIRAILGGIEFDVMINSAAQTNVDRCETHQDEAFLLNAEAPRVLAEICSAKRAKLIHISTDYVFDGRTSTPCGEDDPANPISVYGESKLEGEKGVLEIDVRHVAARVSWVFGPDRPSFIDWLIGQAREKEEVQAVADKFSTPTYTVDVAEMLRPLMEEDGTSGIFHLANDGGCSWQEYGQWALDCCIEAGLPMKARHVGAISLADMKNFIAQRPVHTVLSTEKYQRLSGRSPRHWKDAVAEYVREHVQSRNS